MLARLDGKGPSTYSMADDDAACYEWPTICGYTRARLQPRPAARYCARDSTAQESNPILPHLRYHLPGLPASLHADSDDMTTSTET